MATRSHAWISGVYLKLTQSTIRERIAAARASMAAAPGASAQISKEMISMKFSITAPTVNTIFAKNATASTATKPMVMSSKEWPSDRSTKCTESTTQFGAATRQVTKKTAQRSTWVTEMRLYSIASHAISWYAQFAMKPSKSSHEQVESYFIYVKIIIWCTVHQKRMKFKRN